MKKYIYLILICLMCFFLTSAIPIANAEEDNSFLSPTINTIYPEDIIDYADLIDVTYVTTNNYYIAYTVNTNQLYITNATSKNTIKITDYNNIMDIKFVQNNQLLVVDYNKVNSTGNIYSIKITENDDIQHQKINGININNLKFIDFYTKNDIVYIGLIKSEMFEFYKLKNNTTILSAEKQHHYELENLLADNNHNITLKNFAINDTHHYISYINSDDETRIIYEKNNIPDSNQITPKEMLKLESETTSLMKSIIIGSENYLLVLNNKILYLLSNSDFTNPLCQSSSTTKLDFTDIDIYNNNVYSYDKSLKAIESFNIEYNPYKIEMNKTLIASKSKDLGRFNSVSDICIQGDSIFVSDTKNDRIQIIGTSIIEQIKTDVDSNPHSLVLDSDQNIYIVTEDAINNKSTIVKYGINDNNEYTPKRNYASSTLLPLGLIADTTITTNNKIFLIDYTYNQLLTITDSGLSRVSSLNNIFISNSDTKLEYIKDLDLFVVLNTSSQNKTSLYLLNLNPKENEDVLLNQIELDCSEITSDLSGVYALCGNQIKFIKIIDKSLKVSEKYYQSSEYLKLTTISYDIASAKLYGFNSAKQCIVYIDSDISCKTFNFSNINNSDLVPASQMPIAINISNNAIIYEKPYNIGKAYRNITKCIGIELVDNYYRVLFNYNNNLVEGFIENTTTNISIIPFNSQSKIKVLITNLEASVFQYPSLLPYNNTPLKITTIPIKTPIYVSNEKFPVSIDGIDFYLYEVNGKIGFIFNANIILSDESNIVPLNTNNATIKAIEKEKVELLLEDKTTILLELDNNTRIYVENYDKNNKYTKIIYKDDNLTTYEGYIETKYIQMDKLDNHKVVLIIIIILSIIILIVITTTYIIIKKKK